MTTIGALAECSQPVIAALRATEFDGVVVFPTVCQPAGRLESDQDRIKRAGKNARAFENLGSRQLLAADFNESVQNLESLGADTWLFRIAQSALPMSIIDILDGGA